MKFSDKAVEWAWRRMEALHSKSGHLAMTDEERAAEDVQWLDRYRAELEARLAAK